MNNLGIPNISIQINQNCNFACSHCGFQNHYRKNRSNRPTYMPPDLFSNIVDQYHSLRQQEQKYLSLSAGGEPLLHPDFLTLCKYVDQCDISFGFDTNASLLVPEVSGPLLTMQKFKRIVFSIDSLSPRIYASIRVGGSLEEVHENVFGFLNMAKKVRRDDIHTRVNIVEQPGNQHEIDDFIRYWAPHVSQVNIIQRRYGTRVFNPNWQPDQRTACRFLYSYMRILTDGTVVFCCVDDDFKSVIGSVIDSSIVDIWHGPMYESLRIRQRDGDFRSPEICYDCNCWTGFFAPRSYKCLQPNIVLEERPLSIVAKKSKCQVR